MTVSAMNSLLVVSCSLIIYNSVHCSNEVPVLAWGSGSDVFDFNVHAHKKLSTAEFSKNLLSKLTSDKPSVMVAFVEESLSPEDLVAQDADQTSAYPMLERTIESECPAKYLPYVVNPLKALKALDYETHEMTSSQLLQNTPHSTKALYIVKLDDVENNGGRMTLLRRHDEVIHKLCSKLQKELKNVVCLLTAERPSWIESEKTVRPTRKLLQLSDSVDSNFSRTDLNLYYQEYAGIIYTKSQPILFDKNNSESFNLSMPAVPTITKGNNALVLFLISSRGRFRLSFNFILPNMTSSWQLNSIGLTDPLTINQVVLLKTKSYIGASLGNSFHTPRSVIFDSDNYTLTFEGLQVQYFNTRTARRFGPAEDSVYFFTIPILSGLFVTSLLVTIVLIGLTMIFDIKTMDQFDDPKGRSITINAVD